MRGRRPAPRETKIAKGETRPSRVNYDEPDVPPPDDTGAPKELKGDGFRLFRDYFKQMVDTGQLRRTDRPAFVEHCKTLSAVEKWRAEFAVAEKLHDIDRQMRIQRILNQLGSRSIREEAELGMTPVSRSRVKTVTKAPVTKPKHDRFFKGLRGISGGRA